MIDSNFRNNTIALLTLKGEIHVYQVLNPEQNPDCVKPTYSTNIQTILKSQQTAMMMISTNDDHKVVGVQHMRILNNGNIDVILSN